MPKLRAFYLVWCKSNHQTNRGKTRQTGFVLVWLSGFVSVWIFAPDTKKWRNCVLFALLVWLSGFLEESTLTKTEFLQTMRQTVAKPAPPPDPIAEALRRAGIPIDAPYYAGAFRNVEQALSGSSPIKKGFWQPYLLSLCAQLHQLERNEKKQDSDCLNNLKAAQEQLRTSIHTVQAILYAIRGK